MEESGKLKRRIEIVRRDIETLKESIDSNRTRTDPLWPTRQEVRETIEHTTWCLQELQRLKGELERLLNQLEK